MFSCDGYRESFLRSKTLPWVLEVRNAATAAPTGGGPSSADSFDDVSSMPSCSTAELRSCRAVVLCGCAVQVAAEALAAAQAAALATAEAAQAAAQAEAQAEAQPSQEGQGEAPPQPEGSGQEPKAEPEALKEEAPKEEAPKEEPKAPQRGDQYLHVFLAFVC